MNFLAKFVKLLQTKRPLRCLHPNSTTNKWLDDDGTPMMEFHCPDCGAWDRGHVYADPATWLEPSTK